jgi:excisionase family DNA binding protein
METETSRSKAQPLLVSRKEACSYLGGICLRTLEKLIAEKKLPTRKIGRRTLIPFSALQAFTRGK